jgi:hypothetical protein
LPAFSPRRDCPDWNRFSRHLACCRPDDVQRTYQECSLTETIN